MDNWTQQNHTEALRLNTARVKSVRITIEVPLFAEDVGETHRFRLKNTLHISETGENSLSEQEIVKMVKRRLLKHHNVFSSEVMKSYWCRAI